MALVSSPWPQAICQKVAPSNFEVAEATFRLKKEIRSFGGLPFPRLTGQKSLKAGKIAQPRWQYRDDSHRPALL
jgi:hypothetical protein